VVKSGFANLLTNAFAQALSDRVVRDQSSYSPGFGSCVPEGFLAACTVFAFGCSRKIFEIVERG